MAAEKLAIDWAAIEVDYRSGSMPIREMARWYSIPESTLRKRAKLGGWERKGAQPAKAAHSPAPRLIVATPLTPENADPKAIIGRGRNLVLRLLDELDAVTTNRGELEDMILDETKGDSNPGRRQAMMKAVELPTRANTIKALAQAYKTLAEAGSPAGKKEAAQEAATTAGDGTGWGADLRGPAAMN